MTYSIALAGKGGTGKTTLAGFIVRFLVEKGKIPVLAVDADANSNLNEVLGVEISGTLGEAREEMKKGVPTGMTKNIFMEMKLQQAVTEADGFDLIVMGRPEGPGCYCAANSLLAQYLEKLMNNYSYIVMDNEAGMEHLSRLTTNNVDALLVVSDSSKRGLQAAERILRLADDLKLNINEKYVIVNLAKDGQEDGIRKAAKDLNLKLAGIIPEDDKVREFDLDGKPTMLLPNNSLALIHAYEIFENIIP